MQVLHDMCGGAPMLRLLSGDVGCGKTLVALLALLAAAGSGLQARRRFRSLFRHLFRSPAATPPRLHRAGDCADCDRIGSDAADFDQGAGGLRR